MRQQNRQPVTRKSVFRRLRDARLDRLSDKRSRRGRRYTHLALIHGLMIGLLSAARSLREVEALTASLNGQVRKGTKIQHRISDTKLRDTLMQVDVAQARHALHRQVKAEHRRGNLKPDRFPFGVVAIDGKGLGKLDRWDHPDIMRIQHQGQPPYGLARAHRAHLVSAKATLCVDQRPIPGDSNEMGNICQTTQALIETYGRTDLFEVITVDAGNASVAHADLIHDHNLGYVFTVKENCGDIYQEALRQLAQRTSDEAEERQTRREKGARVTHRLWRAPIRGFLRWSHARQLVRIQRVVEESNGSFSEGNRYFVTNLPTGRLNASGWLTLVRMHWRCENSGHWSTDVVWKEDAKRTPWITSPQAVYALAILRMIALNILAMLRRMSRREWESKPPPWNQVVQAVRFTLASSSLVLMERFDFD